MIKRRLVLLFIGVGIAIASFVAGRFIGSVSASEKRMSKEMNRLNQLAELDKTALQTFPVRSNTMTSGTYLMQVWFPKSQLEPRAIALRCENGQITVPGGTFSRSGGAKQLAVTGNVVSWDQEGALYQMDAIYVGLVDGNEMWGRV